MPEAPNSQHAGLPNDSGARPKQPMMEASLPSGGGTANRETTLPMVPGAADFGRDMPGQGSDSGVEQFIDPKFLDGHDAR